MILCFVGVWDIGFADFKFDMRRLQEILAFPKAWYRSGLARRLFLGDESMPPAAGMNSYQNNLTNESIHHCYGLS